MYAQSATRQASVAAVLVATLAGIVAASVEGGSAAVSLTASSSHAPAFAESLPRLPEVVVTASRLPS